MANAVEASGLDVLQPDQFEGEAFDQEDVHRIQASYYKGAPPQWVNFYLAERSGTPFVKRDGYEKMKRLIETHRRKRKVKVKVNLLHQPGSGGSTLAMQVLWDLRKDFQCAKVEDLVIDSNVIAKDVINLAIRPNIKQNKGKPVLILLDNADKLKGYFVQTLQRLIDKLNDIKSLHVIILNCVRKVEFATCNLNNTVLLNATLQMERKGEMGERGKFDQHHRSVIKQFENEHNMFHGFNLIRGDFSSEYKADVCNVIVPPKTPRRPCIDQLFAILALVNTYAPGSDFLLDQCEKFLQNRKHSTNGPPMFEEQMGRFSDLLVTYTNFEKNTHYVRIAHPMIATKCVQLFTDHGLSMGEVTFLFLQNFCANTASPRLMQTTKSMLTMREMQGKNEDKERFPKLIQHIYKIEGKGKCRRLLEKASKVFQKCPSFPQALARCCYLMIDKRLPRHAKDYINAEKWAKEAIKRHPNNSFIMDTLGQVHKHHLFHYVKNGEKKCQSEVLRLGLLAINAFQEEEMAAEEEEAEESEATANFSSIFNTSGKLGYLQVAEKLFESLVKINKDWSDVLTCSRKIQESLAVQLPPDSRNLTISLKAEVKKRFEFFEKYLTYSKPDSMKDDPIYIRKCAYDCYAKYVETPPTVTDLQEFLRREDTYCNPECYHLALLQPAEDQSLMGVVMKMRESYKIMYEKYFRSRYLAPLYMRSTEGWQTLSELSLQHWEIEKGTHNDAKDTEDEADSDQKNTEGRLLHLVRVQGRIQRPKVLAFLENTEIEVEPHNKENVLEDGDISFYLGFNIKGPVAFNIKYEENYSTRADVGVSPPISYECLEPQLREEENGDLKYTLRCPTAGLFECKFTSLMFKMEKAGEVEYRSVPWENKLENLDCEPAGPLYSISCFPGTPVQIHLPHCEVISDGKLGHLRVAHITGDGLEIISPTEITESHVVIDVTGLSPFGLITSLTDYLLGRNIRAMVLLFLQTRSKPELQVLLLPSNTDTEMVKKKRDKEIHIDRNPYCIINTYRYYSLFTDHPGLTVTPNRAQYVECSPNFSPAFTVHCSTEKELKLILKDEKDETKDVWNSLVNIEEKDTPDERQCVSEPSVREDFFQKHKGALETRLSVLGPILNQLVQKKVLNTTEREAIQSKTPDNKKNECLIRILDKKGTEAQEIFCQVLQTEDPFLVKDLEKNI